MKATILHFIALSLSIFLVTALFAKQSGQILINDKTNLMRKQNIDIKHISLDLKLDWSKKQAYGTAAITFSPLAETNTISLDAGMLTVNSVTLQTGNQLSFSYDGSDKNDALKITLDRIYKPSEEITLIIDYHTNHINNTDPMNIWGSNGKGIRFFEPSSTEPTRRKQAWSIGEPESNRYWFPCYDSPDDLRTSELKLTVDNGMTVISNGSLIEKKQNSEGSLTFHWKTDVPIANHLTSFVAGEYTEVRNKFDDIKLISYGYPDEKDAVEASVVMLPDMIRYFSEVTGVKYPYKSYSQVFVQELPGWVGNHTATAITENMVDDYRTHADFFYLWDQTEAEALASQWFGNHIICGNWADVWLNRSFAHYFNELYNEQKNGKEEFLLYQRSWDENTYHWDRGSGIIMPVVNPQYEDAYSFVNDNYTYFHGASVLHMLRKHLGDESWWKAIKLYCKNNGGKIVSTADFQKAVNEAAGENMDWFFDQWVYRTGHPVFEIQKKYNNTKKELQLIVRQTQKTDTVGNHPQTGYFKGKVDIEIDDKVTQLWLEPKEENIFTFSLPKEPMIVNFDYESTWIKEITFNKSLEELLYQFSNDKDIMGRHFAMNELVKIAKDDKTSDNDKSAIYSAFRKVIQSSMYWRFRLNALAQLRNLIVNAGDPKPAELDEETLNMLLTLVAKEKAWVLTSAITFLGMTKDAKYADIYINGLKNESERVVNASAIALGKCRSPKAYDELIKLKDKPSWKNQSLISSLNGLKELGDKRAVDLALYALTDSRSPHWTLAVSVWDHRLAAAETLVSLGFGNKGYDKVIVQFNKAVGEGNINDIFYNVQLLTVLADPRGKDIFESLSAKFKNDPGLLNAVEQYKTQFMDAVK